VGKGGYQQRRIREQRQQEKTQRKQRRRRRRLLTWLLSVVVLGLIGGGTLFLVRGSGEPKASSSQSPSPSASSSACTSPGPDTIGKKTFALPPCEIINPEHTYIAHMQTSMGPINLRLDPRLAPKTVNNVVFLAQQGYYDGTIFHRVQKESDFAIVQGGDPNGDGSGGPGYQYGGETPSPITKYKRGFIAMANSGSPDSNGSQFFIVVKDWPSLPANYTFFGAVDATDKASFGTLDKMIETKGEPIGNGLGLRPDPPITLIKVTIEDAGKA